MEEQVLEENNVTNLLSNEEINQLFEQINENDKYSQATKDNLTFYFNKIDKMPLLTPIQEREVAKKITLGDVKARELMIESNLRLVVSVALQYNAKNLSLLDLIQEGNIGLMTAIKKYDVNRNLKFSTYAYYWIKKEINKAMYSKDRSIRIPHGVYQQLSDYKKAKRALTLKLNREPINKEISEEMNLPISKVDNLEQLLNNTLSVDSIINGEIGTIEELLPSPEKTPSEITRDTDLKEQINKLIENSKLKQRERDILKLRYGFNDIEPMTLVEICNYFNVTIERVRQLELSALKKLRKSNKTKELAFYMRDEVEALNRLELFRKAYNNSGALYVRDLTSDGSVEKRKNTKPRKVKSLYLEFNNYTKEQIDSILLTLNEEEQALVKLRYGGNLETPVPTKLTKRESNKFYLLKARIKEMLLQLDQENIINSKTLTKPNVKIKK